MTSLSWSRFGLLWSACWLVFSLAHAVSADVLGLALVHAACALTHLGLCVWSLRVARFSRRLLAAVAAQRRVDRLRLSALAWLGVWDDRLVIDGPSPRTMSAHLGAVRAAACYQVAVTELEFLP